ncbi:MAG: LysR family transcriptional regulator [Thomasclavelia ramosa]
MTKAAHNLYISQTAVTKQIQLLETELGTKLFNRNNKQIELTEVGRFF